MNERCKCENPPFNHYDYDTEYIVEGDDYADVSIETCKLCGKRWLKYLIEEESFSQSGRWWRVELGDSMIDPGSARKFIEAQAVGFMGGSYYGHAGRLFEGKVIVR